MPFSTHRRAIGYTIGAIILLLMMTIAVYNQPYLPGDVSVTRALQSLRSPWLDAVMTLIGLPGSPPQTVWLNASVVLILLLCRLKPEALTMLIFIPTFGTVSTVIRCGIDRARPSADLVDVLDPFKDRGCSFPSGHTGNFVIIMGFMIFIGLTLLAPSWHRNLLLWLYGLYIALMGISRIYVGDHWPSDVIGGELLGSIFLVWMVIFYQWVKRRFFLPVQQRSDRRVSNRTT